MDHEIGCTCVMCRMTDEQRVEWVRGEVEYCEQNGLTHHDDMPVSALRAVLNAIDKGK